MVGVNIFNCVCDDCCKPLVTKFSDLAYDFCITQPSYVYSLGTNLEKLENARCDLKHLMDSVMGLVETAEQSGEQRISLVEEWFKKVAIQRAVAEKLHKEGQQQREKLPCTVKVCSIYVLGFKIVAMIKSLTDLKKQGDEYKEKGVASSDKWFLQGNCSPHAEGDSNRKYATVGNLEAHKEEVLEYLEGPEEWIVGVCGRGGVGKTTLLRLINKHFVDVGDSNLDLVIYVEVKDLGVEDIQKAIREKMKFLNDWRYESVEQRAEYISTVLQKKQQQKEIRKCVLLLDDIRKSSFLIEDIVGKHPDHHFKVVFTTRRSTVVNKIMAKKTVIVETLKEEHGRELFEKAAGINKSTTSARIQRKSVPTVIRLCSGLPSALVRLGEELVEKNHEEWEDMIGLLQNPAQQNDKARLFEEMKYSYELLDADCQECFLYSCVFLPGDSYIPTCELEELWIYGDCSIHFIGKPDDRRHRAREIIRTLSDESLLDWTDKGVKLHNVVRCMGLWLAKDRMVLMGSSRENSVKDQKKRVLLMTNELPKNDTLPKDARRNLRTLFVTNNEAPGKMIDDDQLFKGMDALAVLKLSGSGVKELPKSISGLRSLKYLDISFTKIRKLPKLMKYLNYLNVNDLDLEFDGSKKVISKLSCLQVLRMLCGYSFEKKVSGKEVAEHVLEEHMLEVLKSLECLNVLEIELRTSSALEKLFNDFEELLKKMRRLSIRGFKKSETDGKCVVYLSKKTDKLVELLVTGCESEELIIIPRPTNYTSFSNITKVTVENCHFLQDLTYLVLLTDLQVLKVSNCGYLKEIIRREKLPRILFVSDGDQVDMQESMFPDLAHLYLEHLPDLECIYQCCHSGDLPQELVKYPRSLPLKRLCELQVHICPKLKKLPFGADSIDGDGSAKKIQLHASEDWWKAIEGEDNDARSAWLPRFDYHFKDAKKKTAPR